MDIGLASIVPIMEPCELVPAVDNTEGRFGAPSGMGSSVVPGGLDPICSDCGSFEIGQSNIIALCYGWDQMRQSRDNPHEEPTSWVLSRSSTYGIDMCYLTMLQITYT